jgi:hypothetical protein
MAGEVHALVSENGVGKIDADEDPGRCLNSGEILCNGAPVDLRRRVRRAAHGQRMFAIGREQ